MTSEAQFTRSENSRRAALLRYSNVEERFWSRVIITPGCWIYTGTLDGKGYGLISTGGRRMGAHVWAWEHYHGHVSPGLDLDHLCRIPACCNPGHLEPVSHRENVLRGMAPAAINARKTHCLRGHPLAGENLYVRTTGARACRTCQRAHQANYQKSKKSS